LLLQLLLKLTIAAERQVAAFFKARQGVLAKFMRFFCAWLVLSGSKFVILESIDFAFGDRVDFGGPFHGLGVLVAVIVTMLIVEEAIMRLYRRLG
jgi:hypothetical protein